MDCNWYLCQICGEVWYVFNAVSPPWLQTLLADATPKYGESIRQECPRCRNRKVVMLDMKRVACSWVESVVGCKAIFCQNGYFKDGNPNWGPPIEWDSEFEKEMVYYDADFKRIISFLKNKITLDHSFKLAPDVYESDERSGHFKFKAYYPTLEEALKKKILQANSLQVVHFLRREGALQPDKIAFSFCPNCGSKNLLSFRMQEKGCDACDYAENPDCDENCPEYDSDGGCMTHEYPKICCPGASDGDCDGARVLEASCARYSARGT